MRLVKDVSLLESCDSLIIRHIIEQHQHLSHAMILAALRKIMLKLVVLHAELLQRCAAVLVQS